MEIRHFKALLAVARTGSFYAAARELRISQPAVSAHVAQLEEEVNFRLVERVGETRLTKAGEQFAFHAARMVAAFDDAETLTEEIRQQKQLCLRIGFSRSHKAAAETAFIDQMKSNPSLRVYAEQGEAPALEQKLLTGELDVALCYMPSSKLPDGIEPMHQARIPLYVVVKRGHALAVPGPIKREALKASTVRLAMFRSGLRPRTVIDAYFKDKARKFNFEYEKRIAFETNVIDMLFDVVEELDDVVAVLPLPASDVKKLRQTKLTQLSVHELIPEPKEELCSALLWRNDTREALQRDGRLKDQLSAAEVFADKALKARGRRDTGEPARAPEPGAAKTAAGRKTKPTS